VIEPSTRLVELIKGFETFSPTAYICPGGKPTIGYGTTAYPDGKPVKMGDATITRETAEAYLVGDLCDILADVRGRIIWDPPDNVVEACASLAYNIGQEAFATSTCLKRLNDGKGNVDAAAAALQWWNKATDQRTGKKRILGGLVARRKVEADLMVNGWDGTSSASATTVSIEEVKPTLTKSRTVWSVLATAGSGAGPLLILLWPEIQARVAGLDTNALGTMTPKQLMMSLAGVVGGAILAVMFKRQDLHDGQAGSQSR
jgi:lysozyme